MIYSHGRAELDISFPYSIAQISQYQSCYNEMWHNSSFYTLLNIQQNVQQKTYLSRFIYNPILLQFKITSEI